MRVLVVDDDPDLLASMRQLIELSMPGVEVVVAKDGQEAWDILRNNGIRAVVTDYMMPRMDGIELAVAAHERKPGLPVIMVTAFQDETLRAAAERAGVNWFVPKPFTVADFLGAVQAGIAA